MTAVDLLANPNKHAPSIKYRSLFGQLIYVSGYQRYLYLQSLQKPIPLNRLLARKSEILEKVYSNCNVYENIKSVLDIGSNNGYFLLQARYFGVKSLLGVDIDPKVKKLYEKNYMSNISVNIQDYKQLDTSHDMVIALSLTHRMIGQLMLGSSGDKKRTLHTMFNKLSTLTNYVAIIELVTSDDEVIVKYGHHTLSIQIADYLDVAKQYFTHIEYLGSTRFSRHIYSFYKQKI